MSAKRIGSADIVGFGRKNVLIMRNGIRREIINASTKLTLQDGWSNEKHIRTLGDTTGDGHLDLIGFGDTGVFVSRNNGDNTFQSASMIHGDLSYNMGWRADLHPRFAVDLWNRGFVDFVGWGKGGLSVTKNNGDGTFQDLSRCILYEYGYEAGWRADLHIRLFVDLTGDGVKDVIAFGDKDVSVCLGTKEGVFKAKQSVIDTDLSIQHNWHTNKHPRLLGDITGDGKPDIVGFGEKGVTVALSKGDGTFDTPKLTLDDFSYEKGWRIEKHLRFLADMNGNGRLDIVGFGDKGVIVSFSNGDGTS